MGFVDVVKGTLGYDYSGTSSIGIKVMSHERIPIKPIGIMN